MTIVDVFETSKHRTNIAHFTTIVNLAIINGNINAEENEILKKFAKKLDISPEEYKRILKEHEKFPCVAINSCKKRLEHLYDLFRLVYADHEMSAAEKNLVLKYAMGLGIPINKADEVIERSIKIFSGNIDFEDYYELMNK